MCAFSCALLLFHSISWSTPGRCCNLVRLTALCKYGWKTHSDLFFEAVFYYGFVTFLSTHFLYLRCPVFLLLLFLLEVAVCNSKNQNRINLDSFLPIYTFAPCYFFTAFRRRMFYFCKNSLVCKVNHDAIDIWFNNSVVIMQMPF